MGSAPILRSASTAGRLFDRIAQCKGVQMSGSVGAFTFDSILRPLQGHGSRITFAPFCWSSVAILSTSPAGKEHSQCNGVTPDPSLNATSSWLWIIELFGD